MNPCPNHPAGRTCPACDKPFNGTDAASLLLRWLGAGILWITGMLVFIYCPVTIFFWIGILVVWAIIKSAIVAAGRELRKL
jgi:hypothetical protein